MTGRQRRWPCWLLAVLFVGRADPGDLRHHPGRPGRSAPWWTILLLVADGVCGAWLVKREGGRAWRRCSEALGARRAMPATELADAALVLVGGTLLLTPGFVTDVFGLFCVLPFTRPLARRLLPG